MDWVRSLLQSTPEISLFVCLALGYLVGKLRVGPIQLGGICGTLIVAMLVGLLDVTLDDQVKNVAFALFIFALGYTGGPQFFANLNRSGLKIGVLSFIEAALVVTMVLTLASLLDLGVGVASGIMAGSATESAVVGTASEAIAKLGLPADEVTALQGQVATAYTVCYLFGLVTIVLFTSGIGPAMLRVDLRESAAALLRKMGGGDDDPAKEPAMPAVVGRRYEVGPAAGRTIAELEASLPGRAAVEQVVRDGRTLPIEADQRLAAGDQVVLVARREALVDAEALVGDERTAPDSDLKVETRDIVITAKELQGATLDTVRVRGPVSSRGVFFTGLSRSDQHLQTTDSTELHRGDVLSAVGVPADLDRVTSKVGYAVPRSITTDFVYLGLGVTVGMLVGKLTLHLGDVPLSLGTGGGALLSGLVFGWFRARHRLIGNLPPAAAAVMKDLGLATFIAAVGLSAAPQAGPMLRQYGLLLPFAGIGMVLIPALVSLYIGHRLLKIEPPILMGAIAGQQCSTPAISSVTGVAGNTVPLIGYTITYALSSILLPLAGPVVVGVIGA
ncbi:MAG: aspartate-alanine antiporter [Saccharothrix sp.]|nr:aspartate-alanine antiporter [Saccharothrix sp.]